MLNWTRINELRTEVGDDEFQLILELALDEVEGMMMRLSKKDAFRLETELHFLKGCAWNLGFRDFGHFCEAGEWAAAAGRPDDVAIQDLMRSYSESKQALMCGLDASLHPGQGEKRA